MFHEDMSKLAKENDFFQREVYRDKNIQIVLMSLAPGEDIGMESHNADQSTMFVAGTGAATVDGKKAKVGASELIVIPKGAEHNIANTGRGAFKLFSIYAPPAEPAGVRHKTKADAEAAEEGFVSRALKKAKELAS